MNWLKGAKVIETRRRSSGLKYRRYETPEGMKITTFEVPTQVIAFLGKKRLLHAMQQAERSFETQKRVHKVKTLLLLGWKPAAVAHEVGLSEARVRQIRKEMKS